MLPVAGQYPAVAFMPPYAATAAISYIEQAFRNLNVFQPGSVLPDAQATDALVRLNLMMSSWSQQLTPYVITRDTIANVVPGKGGPGNPYTWGVPNGDILTPKPSNQQGVVGAALILQNTTPAVEVPLAILTDAMWASTAIKNLQSSQPTSLYYSPTVPFGSVYLWPLPNNGVHGLAIYRESTFGPFADLRTTTYTFPDGYDEAIVYNLERRLAAPYGRDMPADDLVLARETWANIFRSNQRLSDLPNDFTLGLHHGRHGYNIETGNL